MLDRPYSGLYDYEDIDQERRRAIFDTRWLKDRILPEMVERLPDAFHPDGELLTDLGVGYEELIKSSIPLLMPIAFS